MTITNGLITVDDFSVYVKEAVPTGEQLERWETAITIASRWTQRHTGRQFYKSDTAVSPTATARYFDPSHDAVYIDDCYSITSVEVDDADDGTHSTTTTTYQAIPAYGRDSVLGDVAYTKLAALSGLCWPNYTRRGSVKVTALWGWETVPEDVKQAVCVYTQDLLRDKDTNFGGLAINDSTGLVVGSRVPDRTLLLLAPWRRFEFVAGIG